MRSGSTLRRQQAGVPDGDWARDSDYAIAGYSGCNLPNLGVGLDTANLILYGKANPVDALEIVGPHVKSVHAKDGMWPTDPMQLGKEVAIGKGAVDFPRVLAKLHQLGYRGAITIEREISGPQQMEDIKREKAYLEQILSTIGSQS